MRGWVGEWGCGGSTQVGVLVAAWAGGRVGMGVGFLVDVVQVGEAVRGSTGRSFMLLLHLLTYPSLPRGQHPPSPRPHTAELPVVCGVLGPLLPSCLCVSTPCAC